MITQTVILDVCKENALINIYSVNIQGVSAMVVAAAEEEVVAEVEEVVGEVEGEVEVRCLSHKLITKNK